MGHWCGGVDCISYRHRRHFNSVTDRLRSPQRFPALGINQVRFLDQRIYLCGNRALFVLINTTATTVLIVMIIITIIVIIIIIAITIIINITITVGAVEWQIGSHETRDDVSSLSPPKGRYIFVVFRPSAESLFRFFPSLFVNSILYLSQILPCSYSLPFPTHSSHFEIHISLSETASSSNAKAETNTVPCLFQAGSCNKYSNSDRSSTFILHPSLSVTTG